MSELYFEYLSDWANNFEAILKNEIREEIQNQNKIKANIVESNQSFDNFLKRNSDMKIAEISKEDFFKNVIWNVKGKNKPEILYFDISNPRFWIVHNISASDEIKERMDKILSSSYLQDSIYLSHRKIEHLQQESGASSLGFRLEFNQLFIDENNSAIRSELKDFEQIGFSMHLWPKRKKSVSFFLEKLNEIECPVNYRSLNFVFEDENSVLVKEDLFQNGSVTIHRGSDFKRHLKFMDQIREKYSIDMHYIEDYRFDWINMKGSLFFIEFDKEIEPPVFIDSINNPKKNDESFKINAFYMYQDNQNYFYSCIDLHTGVKFYLQVNPKGMYINLGKQSCGNIVFRLFTNLQRWFSIKIKLYIDGIQFDI
ncbi:MAG: hypothetical protein JW870_11045 [Candidatus Delongbacteria bacterium]|nr:hypothetical protein [Candidatus Delongbacteria bacterium]